MRTWEEINRNMEQIRREVANRLQPEPKSKDEFRDLCTGQCYFCGKGVGPKLRFCSSRCHRIRTTYGLTLSVMQAMYRDQDERCKICRLRFTSIEKVHIDHDRDTNKVRALLCRACNSGLGLFKDNAENLRRASEYVSYYAEQNKTRRKKKWTEATLS